MPSCDLAIVGSGFAGSLLALIARRLGLRVVLLERGRHPRFAIGESASPLAGVLLEQLADRYELPRLRPLASYGAWRRTYPHLTCGLKRGFSYFKHEDGRRYRTAPDRANQLLVAASPNDEVSDTHWLRADVDHFLANEASDAGAAYIDLVHLERLERGAAGGVRLLGSRQGSAVRIEARLVVDASGPRGFVSTAMRVAPAVFDGYPATQALYSHFHGVARCEAMADFAADGRPPFPPDDAALHHVFDEGWMWVLRFDNGVTSAGIAVTDRLAADLRLADGEAAWRRFLSRYPSVAAQFADARPIREFTWIPRVAWRTSSCAGPGWVMLPSAAAFVDPLFSTGMPMTLLGVERLARILEDGGLDDAGARVAAYERATLLEADHTAAFIGGCYAGFRDFPAFSAYAMLYFAAASFSEMARRLGATPPGFLCAADQRFAGDVRAFSPASRVMAVSMGEIGAAIERINVAGLADPARRNWYSVDLEDPVRGAAKLGTTAEAVRAMLAATLQT